MSRKVAIDVDECIGCGTCESICPEVFSLDEESGKSQIIKAEGGPQELIQEAIDSCPAQCISWLNQ
ncbi:ferredoxin [Desulfonatronovibrio hydrogenovorans]|uniref:ferredoxin n=1 Tax=Desulfonatronovibrio hydrogenovorans TaxID=53245 RepID=UPI00048B9E2F|nr:ferredoxin [Desulfonatronovibrio hydrogenovorans]